MKSDYLLNFMLVGAAKSGTTTIADCLEQHPDVFMASMKEPNYFSNVSILINSKEDYCALFKNHKGEKAVGEASSSYLFIPETAKNIYSELGKIKIIISLRNPVTRAFSNWNHVKQHKKMETLPFKEALEMEETRYQNRQGLDWWPGLMYFRTGLYHDQVERYFNQFGQDNVFVLIFERFITDPYRWCKQLYRFLEVDPDFTPQIDQVNKSHEPRFQFLYDFVSPPPKLLLEIYNQLPGTLKTTIYEIISKLHRANRKDTSTSNRIPEDLSNQLLEKYLPDINKLENLLGYKINEWY